MALRGTLTHWKTRILASELAVPQSTALGLLEALWNVTAEDAPAGNIGRLPNKAIAMQMYTDLDPDQLIAALVVSGHLEIHPDHRLIVHDWHQHCDDATDNRIARAGMTYASGEAPRMRRLSKGERAHIGAQRAHAVRTESAHRAHDVHTESHDVATSCAQNATKSHEKPLPEPEPVPEPEPLPEPKAKQDQNLPSGKRSADPDGVHAACREHVHGYWRHRHREDKHAPWDGSDAKALDRLIKAKPDLTPERFRQLLACRERSDVNHDERPRVWLERLTDYAGGALDRFGKPQATDPKELERQRRQREATVGSERVDESPPPSAMPEPVPVEQHAKPPAPVPIPRPPLPTSRDISRAEHLQWTLKRKGEIAAEDQAWLDDYQAAVQAHFTRQPGEQAVAS